MARGPYATEPARLEIILLGMQGLGKPGVHQAQIAYLGMPRNILGAGGSTWTCSTTWSTRRSARPSAQAAPGTPTAWGKQLIPKTLIEEAIKNGTVDFWGTGGHEEADRRPVQEVHLSHPEGAGRHRVPHDVDRHPLPRRPAGTAATTSCDAMLSPKIECIVAQHPWLENDCSIRRHHPADQHHPRSERHHAQPA